MIYRRYRGRTVLLIAEFIIRYIFLDFTMKNVDFPLTMADSGVLELTLFLKKYKLFTKQRLVFNVNCIIFTNKSRSTLHEKDIS